MRVARFVKRFLMFLVAAAAAVTLFGFVVMGLWNWLMPALFGWKALTFVQAIGLLVLARLLLGSLRGGPGGFGRHRWQIRMLDRWDQMTPDQREAFRSAMRSRRGWCPPPPTTGQPTP
jgi:hypothetical protein